MIDDYDIRNVVNAVNNDDHDELRRLLERIHSDAYSVGYDDGAYIARHEED